MNSTFYFLPTYFFKYTFQQTLYHFSISFKYYFFILSLIFLYSPFNFPSFIPKNYIHNIFKALLQKIICDKLILIFNLNVLLKFFFLFLKKYFFSPILANNNLPLKIYCENIVVAFLNFNFLFFILFFPYFFILFFIHIISFFFLFFPPLFFSSTHVPLLFSFFSFFPLFSLPLPPNSRSFHRALSLSLSRSLSLSLNF